QDKPHRGPSRLEELDQPLHTLPNALAELEPVSALGIDQDAQQAQVFLQGMEYLLDEVVGRLPAGPVALEPVEQPVKPLGNGARLRPGKTLFHLNGLQSKGTRSRRGVSRAGHVEEGDGARRRSI